MTVTGPGWLFVYGTLMQGLANHRRYLGRGAAAFVAAAWLPGAELYHLPEGYPAAVPAAPDRRVQGELYRIAHEDPAGYAALIARLDWLEGFQGPGDPGNLYERVVRPVRTGQNQKREVDALVYLFARPGDARRQGVLVADGDWRSFLQRLRGR